MDDELRSEAAIPEGRIHPTAVIEPGARIGNGVSIGPNTYIGPNVMIGDGTKVGIHVVIEGWTTIGSGCTIMHSACIGCDPQDLKFVDQRSFVTIGDDNTIREFVTIHRGTHEDEETKIGDGNLLMAYVHVAHNCIVRDNTILANAVALAGHVEVEECAIIGGGTPIHQFTHIGAYAFIGGGSRVAQDVPPFMLAAGNPLRVVGTNTIGLRRRGFSSETRTLIRRAYKMIYRSGKNLSQALETIRKEIPPIPERDRLLSFIESSERGIT